MASCEAVIFFNRDLAAEFDYRCKQAGQLASKMRLMASGWVGVLENGAWMKHAQNGNRCARVLASRFEKEFGMAPAHPVEAKTTGRQQNAGSSGAFAGRPRRPAARRYRPRSCARAHRPHHLAPMNIDHPAALAQSLESSSGIG